MQKEEFNFSDCLPSFCPNCYDNLDREGCCPDCNWHDGGLTSQWMENWESKFENVKS